MLDVGLSEMMVIAVVALVVIGPERLPRVARTLGHLFGRMQRYVNDVKADINREIELDELRKFKDQFQDVAQGVENSIRSGVDEAKSDVESAVGLTQSDEVAQIEPLAPTSIEPVAPTSAGMESAHLEVGSIHAPVEPSAPSKSTT